jgi:[ribosomal protein S5]-alanine N-acetyltransferase
VIRLTTVPHIVTARLELREQRIEDAPALFAALSDPEAMRYWSTPPLTAVPEVEAIVTRNQGYVSEGQGLAWAIVRREDARVLGTLSLHHYQEQNECAEIGYMLAREFWGMGYMHEALTAMVGHVFGELGVRRLEADTDPRNAASIRALERLGFVREGLLRERWVVAGVVSDSLLLGLLRSDWIARQPAGA